MTNNLTTFEEKIKDTFIKYGRVPFLVVLGIVGFLFITYYGYSRIYSTLHMKSKVNIAINSTLQLLEDSDMHNSENVYPEIYKLRNEISDELNVIILDEELNLVTITQPSLEGSDYLQTYNRILASQVEEGKWKTSVFTPLNTQEPYLVHSGKQDNYYIIYYMNNLKKLDFLKYHQGGLVISDSYDNVLYASDHDFINRTQKVNTELFKTYEHSVKNLDGALLIHFFMKKNTYVLILSIVLLALFLTYTLMQKINKVSAKKIGTDFSSSIKLLHEAVKEMEYGNIQSRVEINTDDEFHELGEAFNLMNERLSGLIERNEKLILLNKDAEIKQLEAQFNPHFLYNTLETIKYLVVEDSSLASDLIVETTLLLRYSIEDSKDDIRFKDDLEYIKRYLQIHKMRLEDRFVYDLDIDDDVLDLRLPKLLIQPLIENSLKHGFQNQMNLRLTITSYIYESNLYIYVIDDGGGMNKKQVEELNEYKYENDNMRGYGIKSVIQRLKLMYGESTTFRIHSDNRITIIEIIIKEGDKNV